MNDENRNLMPLANLVKSINDGINGFVERIITPVNNFAYAISKTLHAIATAPIWQELAAIASQYQNWIEKQHILRKTIIEYWEDLEKELKNHNRFFIWL